MYVEQVCSETMKITDSSVICETIYQNASYFLLFENNKDKVLTFNKNNSAFFEYEHVQLIFLAHPFK